MIIFCFCLKGRPNERYRRFRRWPPRMGFHPQGVRRDLLDQVQDRGAKAHEAILGQQLLQRCREEVG